MRKDRDFRLQVFRIGEICDSKIFGSAKIEQEEAEKAEQILNLGTGKNCRILDIEFTENFFEEYEEIFLQFLKMYLGEKTSYLEMYPILSLCYCVGFPFFDRG